MRVDVVEGQGEAARPQSSGDRQAGIMADAVLDVGHIRAEPTDLAAGLKSACPFARVAGPALDPHEALFDAESLLDEGAHRARLAPERVVVVTSEQDRLPPVGPQALREAGLVSDEMVAREQRSRPTRRRLGPR